MTKSSTPANAADAQRAVLNRLRRARGQLDAIITNVETGGSCREVVTQLAAASRALDRAGFLVVSSALRTCLAPENAGAAPDASGDESLTPEELERLFLMLA
ncbi:MAG: metal-sensitive transcriptional regulator [Microbacteriaceae bacterium]|jgi:DNA-binding FrmR family transcriptional regulator|nr:metal-sensitive transcriptional regulator [Microbacteriaceae bacterium]MCI1207239.1 metal-sensitive transcriptional regulator [Microbacteriaceae bacterium]